MNKLTTIPALIATCVVAVTLGSQEVRAGDKAPDASKAADIEILHELVRQSRQDLKMLRMLANRVEAKRGGERGESREGRGEHGGEGRDGRGEHAEGREGGEGRGEEGGEEGGQQLDKTDVWDNTRNGAHMKLAYDAESRSFKGVVTNTTERVLEDVRVEVHLSSGTELGPTKRTSLAPGEKLDVELSDSGERFSWWTTHPEHGSEEGHGPGHEGSEDEGEGDTRPTAPELRPLYNELMLLRSEIKSIRRSFGLGAVSKGREGGHR